MADVDWPALSAEVVTACEPAFADAATAFGKPGTRIVDGVRRTFSLRSENSIREITAVLVLADQAGRTDAFLLGAETLCRVPFTGNWTLYEPIREILCGAHRRCETEGRDNPYEALLTPGEQTRHSRSLLKSRAAGSQLRLQHLDDAAASDGGSHHVRRVCLEIRELYLMWALGGSWRWKRPRIDAEIERGAAALRHVRAIV